MKALILAGGSGTRLWPLSRRNYPKQFLRLNSDKSLLQQTVERLLNVVLPEDIVIITNNEYKFYVKSDITSLSPTSTFNIILEPSRRNTAPAVALGVKYCMERLGCKEDDVVFISPSDHIIRPTDKFNECMRSSEEIAKKGKIITFGIKPSRPETGYGYIKATGKTEDRRLDFLAVERFVEKPDEETAVRYVNEGGYYWNSGMFAFSIETIIDEFQRHAPEIGKMLNMTFDEILSNFDQMPDISIDYAVMEKSDRMVILPLDLYWNDIGSWDSLAEVLGRDELGNIAMGDILMVDTRNTLILGNKRLISTIGLEDCLIVETDDAILISKKGKTQKVREVVNKLKKDNRKEASEHVKTYRPWGSYTILEEGQRYKIKRIVVNPLEKLSLQMHYHRSEHWIVIRGTAKVTIGDKEIFIHENESAYVPKSTIHRLENPGRVPVEIIEVQNGEYLEEDDIVRVKDVYERV